MNIGWIGLGKLGAPCAMALQHFAGHNVIGYDVDRERVERMFSEGGDHGEQGFADLIERGPLKLAHTIGEVVAHADVVFVAVQTPHAPEYGGETPMPWERRDFEYGFLIQAVRDVCRAAAEQAKAITLVVVSTALPGTCNKHLRGLLNAHVTLAYGPLFIAMGTTIQDFRAPEFVLMGADRPEDLDPVAAVYEQLHDRPAFRTSIESAELIKVAYNTVISAKVVIGNMLMEICEKTGADCDEVVDALSLATDRVVSPKYLRGGMGDGGACFPPGEIVITEVGPRPIEEVKVGDLVYTLDGTLQPVLKTWVRDYDGDLISVQPEGLLKTRMTADHPVMARRDLRERMGNGRKPTNGFPRTETAETAAVDLTLDHLVLFPAPEVEVERPLHATPEYMELAGWWLAEGSAYFNDQKGSGRLMWSLHEKETAYADRIAELIEVCAPTRPNGRGGNAKITIEVNSEHKQRNVRFGSKALADRLVGDFGRLQHERSLPPWALWGDQKTAALLLEGLLKGDGHIHKHGVCYSTVSEHLAWGVFTLITRLGFRPSIRSIPPRTGADGVAHRHAYEVRLRNRAQARELFSMVNIDAAPTGQHEVHVDAWRPIRQLGTEHYSGPVHNLWVAGTNTYVVGCGAVHNCHPRDLIAMSWLAQRLDLSYDLLGQMAQAREAQSGWLADLAERWADQTNLGICILGEAYKPGSALTAGSPARLLAHQLRDRQRAVELYDPFVDPGRPRPLDKPRVYVIGTKHPSFTDYPIPAGSVVLDPHGYMPDQPGVTVIRIGRKS